jgi:integrase
LHKEHLTTNESYLNTETRELHLYAGKTQKEGTVRVVEVHPKVVLALKNYRDGLSRVHKETPWVVPTQEDPSDSANADGLRKCLQNALWGKKTPKGVKLAVPVTKMTLQDFRHLYEAHIRYSPSKLTTKEIDAKMKEIGHSPSYALRWYSELYKKIYAHNNGPRCEQDSQAPGQREAEEVDEPKEEGTGATACSEAGHRNRPTEGEQDEQGQHGQ